MVKNITKHRIRYSDTDHFGVVYYARYLDWFEAGRTEILREKGVNVIEYDGDYSKAVAQGRREADADPACHFIDDENS